jgi:hypothetical protein
MSKLHQFENDIFHSFENVIAEKMDKYFVVLFLEAVTFLLLGTMGTSGRLFILGLLLLLIIFLLLGKYKNNQ